MKKYLIVALLFLTQFSFAQVYNFGSNEVTFKNLVKNGITYVRTGNAVFDSIMIANLEEHWTLTEFSVVDQYKKPHKSSTALFVTTKEWTQKHMMDRKNQHVLVLQPAHIYMPRKEVKMEQTLGYMYLNGFYDLVDEEDEFIYCSIGNVLESQKKEGISCQNNYECSTNQCSSGKCIDLEKKLEETNSLIERLLNWFRRIFGGA